MPCEVLNLFSKQQPGHWLCFGLPVGFAHYFPKVPISAAEARSAEWQIPSGLQEFGGLYEELQRF